MWVEPTSTAIGVALCIIAWQQYQIRCLDTDIDNIIDKHNEFVKTVDTVFETICKKANKGDDYNDKRDTSKDRINPPND